MEQRTAGFDDIKDGMNVFERMIKRACDVIYALVGLIVLSPVFFLLYVILRFCGDGSVIYRQERVGYKGRAFNILKFRTMKADTEEDGVPQLTSGCTDQMTPVGKFLREHHLDELPQLWNVLVGDMSVVGPRPERRYFIDQIMRENPDYKYIYKMRPGLTSTATIYNGYTDTMEKMLVRLDMDLHYLRTRSLWIDLKIILITVYFIVSGKKI